MTAVYIIALPLNGKLNHSNANTVLLGTGRHERDPAAALFIDIYQRFVTTFKRFAVR